MSNNRGVPDLSLVILCYKAGDFAPIFVDRVKKVLDGSAYSNYELVLVGNYNAKSLIADKTPEIITNLAKSDSRLVVVAKAKEGMMGWDMRSGLDVTTGRLVAVIDGDGQMPPEDVIKVCDAIRSGDYDVAKTYRDARYDGIWRLLISRVYNLLVKVLFPKVKVKDVNSKPKVFTKSALDRLKLQSDDWFIDAEMIIGGTYLGFRIIEAPTQFYPNENRPSFVSHSAILEFILNLLKYRVKLFRRS